MSSRAVVSVAAISAATAIGVGLTGTAASAEPPAAPAPQRASVVGPLSPAVLRDAFAQVGEQKRLADEAEAARAAEEARQAAEAAAAAAAAQSAQKSSSSQTSSSGKSSSSSSSRGSSGGSSVGGGTTDYADSSNGDVSSWASSGKSQSVIQCESGGNYSTNTGNGYYGAWQFDKQSWDANGGGAYAAYPHQASKAQQDQVAYNYYSRSGWRPWACG